mmetsp:Transcript_17581/g.19787  ORF Transcript_17581/g.19787 Transcript_17581/m.19787 type:complete len:159 (-) Transcript_17581:32-508(-)
MSLHSHYLATIYLLIALGYAYADLFYLKDMVISNLMTAIMFKKPDVLTLALSIYLILVIYATLHVIFPIRLGEFLIRKVTLVSKIILGQAILLFAALFVDHIDPAILINLTRIIVGFILPWGMLAIALDHFLDQELEKPKVKVEYEDGPELKKAMIMV